MFTNGTLRIAEGAALNFVCFDDVRNSTKPGSGCLTVKNLVLDGTVTRESKPDHGESYLRVTVPSSRMDAQEKDGRGLRLLLPDEGPHDLPALNGENEIVV